MITIDLKDTPLLTLEQVKEIANKAIELCNAVPGSHSEHCTDAMKKLDAPCICGKAKAYNTYADFAEHNFESLCHFIRENFKNE